MIYKKIKINLDEFVAYINKKYQYRMNNKAFVVLDTSHLINDIDANDIIKIAEFYFNLNYWTDPKNFLESFNDGYIYLAASEFYDYLSAIKPSSRMEKNITIINLHEELNNYIEEKIINRIKNMGEK
jgi:hypothetical protein